MKKEEEREISGAGILRCGGEKTSRKPTFKIKRWELGKRDS